VGLPVFPRHDPQCLIRKGRLKKYALVPWHVAEILKRKGPVHLLVIPTERNAADKSRIADGDFSRPESLCAKLANLCNFARIQHQNENESQNAHGEAAYFALRGHVRLTWVACQLMGLRAALINPTYPDELLAAMLHQLSADAILWVGRDLGPLSNRPGTQKDCKVTGCSAGVTGCSAGAANPVAFGLHVAAAGALAAMPLQGAKQPLMFDAIN
jgi:hypothetical protein